jgi:NAD(P)H-hydrate epimerase
MERILSVNDMRKSDAQTIEKLGKNGGITLIERAAKAVLDHVESVSKCAILCGSGNNGSDGLALALLVKKSGGEPFVFKTNEKCTPDGEYFLEKVKKEGISVKIGEIPDLSEFDTVFDCLLGTGFTGSPEGIVRDMINAINESDTFAVSVDINSGLSSDSGLFDVCVKSDLTVSIGSYKPGHFLGSAKDVIGRLVNEDIGIAPWDGARKIFLLENSDFSDILRKEPITPTRELTAT